MSALPSSCWCVSITSTWARPSRTLFLSRDAAWRFYANACKSWFQDSEDEDVAACLASLAAGETCMSIDDGAGEVCLESVKFADSTEEWAVNADAVVLTR